MNKVFENIYPFDLRAIAEGGQAFRWNLQSDGSFTGVVGSMVIKVLQKGNQLWIESNAKSDIGRSMERYFDLERDYMTLERQLSEYSELSNVIKQCSGYRILQQDPWETTVSFIISANNSIANIKNSIELLCRYYGNAISYGGRRYYTFPTAEVLAKADNSTLMKTKCGYRARYLLETARKIARGEVDLDQIKELPTPLAMEALQKLPGVGPKVAHCILLFSMQKFDAFPVDTWIKRALEDLYFGGEDIPLKELRDFAQERYGSNAGFVQQYLFLYYRNKKAYSNAKNSDRIV